MRRKRGELRLRAFAAAEVVVALRWADGFLVGVVVLETVWTMQFLPV